MGIGMAFFHSSRMAKFASGEWSNARVVKHFAIRGVLLVLMDRVVNIPSRCLLHTAMRCNAVQCSACDAFGLSSHSLYSAPCHTADAVPRRCRLPLCCAARLCPRPGYVRLVNPENYRGGYVPPGSRALLGLLSIFEVLTALGLSMLVCGALLPVLAAVSARVRYVRRGVLVITGGQILALLLGLGMFVASNVAIVHYQGGADADPSVASHSFPASGVPASGLGQHLLRFVLVPGSYPQGFIAYPLLPWCAICLWSVALAIAAAPPAPPPTPPPQTEPRRRCRCPARGPKCHALAAQLGDPLSALRCVSFSVWPMCVHS